MILITEYRIVDDTKKTFDQFIEDHGRTVLVGHTEQKIHCDCWDPTTDEGKSFCTECFGTGWFYSWDIHKARRTEATLSAMSQNELDLSEEIKVHSTSFEYFFKTETKINTYDFIFEFDDIKKPMFINKLIVTNDDIKSGRKNNDIYIKVLANKVFINNKKIQSSIKKILRGV